MAALDQLAYSRTGAAAATGQSVDTIDRAIKTGALRAKKTSRDEDDNPTGRIVILRSDLDRWLASLPDA